MRSIGKRSFFLYFLMFNVFVNSSLNHIDGAVIDLVLAEFTFSLQVKNLPVEFTICLNPTLK